MVKVAFNESPGFQPGGLSFSWRSIIALVLLLAVFEIAVYSFKVNLASPEFIDTDCYMRLVRVQELYDTGDWYNSDIPRSNAPYGETLHWTRGLDLLLLAGAYSGAPFVGFEKALFWWAMAISPVLQLLSLVALGWAALPLFTKDGLMRLSLLFLGQIGVWECFVAGRPDHHSVLALLFILLIGCCIRMITSQSKGFCWLGGVLAATGIWVSVEFLAAVAMVMMTLAVLWLAKGSDWAKQANHFSITLAGAAGLYLIVERPLGKLLVIEYDKISAVYIFIFIFFVIFWMTAKEIDPVTKNKRMFMLLGGAVIGLLAVNAAFPAFFKGPFALINPRIVPVWLSKVNEVQPLFSLTREGLADTIMLIGPALLVFPYSVIQLFRRWPDGKWVLFVTGMMIFIPLALYQRRWSSYTEIVMVLPLTILLNGMIQSLLVLHSPILRSLGRMVVIMVFCLGFLAAGALMMPKAEQPVSVTITKAADFLNESTGLGATSKTILTSIDFGPEILYRTQHKVIATPYHRNGDGIMLVYDVMTASTDTAAFERLYSRKVDLILICPRSSEKAFYSSPNNADTFYNRLIAGQYPAWMTPVPIPSELDGLIYIYKVDTQDGG